MSFIFQYQNCKIDHYLPLFLLLIHCISQTVIGECTTTYNERSQCFLLGYFCCKNLGTSNFTKIERNEETIGYCYQLSVHCCFIKSNPWCSKGKTHPQSLPSSKTSNNSFSIFQGLKDRNKAPITEVDLELGTGAPGSNDKAKIQSVQDALEFSFPACTKILKEMLAAVDDPEKKNEVIIRDLGVLTEVNRLLDNFLLISPSGGGAPPPLAPHPSAAAPPPIAPHPSNTPPPLSPHPNSPKPTGAAPPPTAPHPSAAKPPSKPTPGVRSAPPPAAPHPSAGRAPAPVAPHPSAGRAPPPVAPHPSAGRAPPPVAPHPRER